jgi:molybdopterin converting factor small subunit
MAVVWVPALMRELTGGEEKVDVAGESMREVINNLDEKFPGFKDRVLDGNRLRPTLSVALDGIVISKSLLEPVKMDSEVSFLPNISGGQ